MNNYLKGYLASIPKSEYDGMINFLKDNITDKLSISKEQFELLLDQIIQDRQPATSQRDARSSEKPSDTYNDFFGNVYIDLSCLFKVVNLLYNAIDGYTNLSSSYLSDIKGEIDKLEVLVKELQAREEYSSNAIVVTETFKNTEYFEAYNDSTSYLFCDRSGEPLSVVDLVHNNTDDMIVLNVSKDVDLLHGKDGKPMGKLDVVDYRGVPVSTYATTSNAIDNSTMSYWDCSVFSDEPISVAMNGLEAGGAYIKFRIRLPAIYEITEIAITPYCIYPVEVCDIQVGGTSIMSTTETSTDTITVRTAKVASDEVVVVLRQKNYTHATDITNAKKEEAEELWNRLLDKPKESYVSEEPRKTETDIYNHYMSRKENEVTIWNEDLIKQKEIGE